MMTGDNIVFDINYICRGCLTDRKETLRPLFDVKILDVFMLCSDIQISELDGLPRYICSSCVYKTVSWFSFRQQCQQSDLALRTQLTHFNSKYDDDDDDTDVQEHYLNDIDVSDKDEYDVGKEKIQQIDEQILVITVEENLHGQNESNVTMLHKSDKTIDIVNDDQKSNNLVENVDKENHDEIELQSNENNQSDNDEMLCNKCGQSFRKIERFVAHQRMHAGQKPEICKICQKQFNSIRALRRHHMKHTNDSKQYSCSDCGRMYKYQTSLTLHKKDHKNIRKYICDLCGKSFVRAHGLQSHMLSHSTDKPYKCDLCNKHFKNEIMLKNHQLRHNGVKKFTCQLCEKLFATSAELTTHTRMHTGDKPYKCSMCEKCFKTKSHLAVHFRFHTGSRPYECDLCSLKFAHNKVLKQHRLTHTGERPYLCEICKRPFRQKSTLNVHMRTHFKKQINVIGDDNISTIIVEKNDHDDMPLSSVDLIEENVRQSIQSISSTIQLLDV